MRDRICLALLLAILGICATMNTAGAQEPEQSADEAEPIVLADVTCKDIMGQGDGTRDRSISFLHGYVLGLLTREQVDLAEMVAAEDRFVDTCLDRPNARAFDMMREAYGS